MSRSSTASPESVSILTPNMTPEPAIQYKQSPGLLMAGTLQAVAWKEPCRCGTPDYDRSKMDHDLNQALCRQNTPCTIPSNVRVTMASTIKATIVSTKISICLYRSIEKERIYTPGLDNELDIVFVRNVPCERAISCKSSTYRKVATNVRLFLSDQK